MKRMNIGVMVFMKMIKMTLVMMMAKMITVKNEIDDGEAGKQW